ncbi:MAG: phosphoenolpyruvate carboxykinase (GTP) [Candidatus Omnitrophica bacterium]|nr:phosphoenolpyruvate carboxykinase (GTP) [Candidatus Omnitrophota bacterium]
MQNQKVREWVDEMARLTKPDRIVWLDGSEAENRRLLAQACESGELIPLNPQKHPGSYLHRSDPQDVARTEHCTFICTEKREDVGPTNNWLPSGEAKTLLKGLFDGVMRGRTLYVIPFLLGPRHSPFSKVGIELTDSLYVAVNMRIMTRMGEAALEELGESGDFIKGLHSTGNLDPQKRYICHFPEDKTIYSINSGYGGNALLSKKCAALRIASWLGREESWLAEHMLIMGIENPQGEKIYIAAALPSACGKTNLAMLQPDGKFKGYRIFCVGDDIAWLRPGRDGQLYAVNPEAGFFGVAPGTNFQTNPNMMKTISRNTLFTNVAMASDQRVWWEGLELPKDGEILDWQGRLWDPTLGWKAAHPNARFTAPIRQCPIYAPEWDRPEGVPISAVIFGCRRSTIVPLICESFHWQHGVYLGATMSSETTAAAAGAVGVVRRDPMAMLPFCGYNMADYFDHWLRIGRQLKRPPRIFRVNWFRTDEKGKFIWPGFGENIRVLKWIMDRCHDKVDCLETPIGRLPLLQDLDLEGVGVDPAGLRQLFEVDPEEWLKAAEEQTEFFSLFGTRLPGELLKEQEFLVARLRSRKGEHLPSV